MYWMTLLSLVLSMLPIFGAVVMEKQDGGGGSGSGASGDGGSENQGAAGDKGKSNEGNAELAKIRAEADAARAEAAKYKADLDARTAAEKKLEEDKKIKAGEAAELLKQRDAENEALKRRVKEIEDHSTKRADEIWSKLPKESQEKLSDLKAALSPEKWVGLLDREAAQLIAANGGKPLPGVPPATGTPATGSGNAGTSLEFPGYVQEVMENNLMREARWPKGVKHEHVGTKNSFIQTVKDMFGNMQRTGTANLNRQALAKRDETKT